MWCRHPFLIAIRNPWVTVTDFKLNIAVNFVVQINVRQVGTSDGHLYRTLKL